MADERQDASWLLGEDLGMRFGRHLLFRALAFRLEGGSSLAITGANGSGKSTLLQMLAGVLRPARGRVVLHARGRSFPYAERPLHSGLVAPYAQVYEGFTARENLDFIARARRLPEAEARIDKVLTDVQLGRRAGDYVATYSSGLKQRVKLAAAILAQPALLLLDEPGATLDVDGRAMVRRVMQRQRDRGRLIVLATNDPREAAWCDRELCVSDFA